MFPRASRLGRRRDIERVVKTGRRLSSPLFSLRYLTTPLRKVRVTVVVGTVVSKKATVRNRAKRQVRHLLRQELVAVQPGRGLDLMLTLKTSILLAQLPQRKQELHELLRRAGIISNTPKH